jgi:hypothetical protein
MEVERWRSPARGQPRSWTSDKEEGVPSQDGRMDEPSMSTASTEPKHKTRRMERPGKGRQRRT